MLLGHLRIPAIAQILAFTLSILLCSRFSPVWGQDNASNQSSSSAQVVSGDSGDTDNSKPVSVADPLGKQATTTSLGEDWYENSQWLKNFDDERDYRDVFQPLDAAFGKYLVGPVASILFFDMYWADNRDEETFNTIYKLPKSLDAALKNAKSLEDQLNSGSLKPKELRAGRNSLKNSIQTAIAGLLNSKIPDEQIRQDVVEIKQAFLDLDNQSAINRKLAAQDLLNAIGKVKGPLASLRSRADMSEDDLLWAMAISADDRTKFLSTNDPQILQAALASAPRDSIEIANQLHAANKLGKSESVFATLKTKGKQGKEKYVSLITISLPFIVVWLVLGAIFFTVRMTFINLRGFYHAIKVTMGKYDDPADAGEISHFQALSSALSATVGLGNIAGVALAVGIGGPGAIVWMIIAGFLGMTSKFTECSLGQMYRHVDESGRVLGGPMRYLSSGLAEMRLGILGKFLAVLFAFLCIGGSFGGGNMFQANQSFAAVKGAIPFFADKDWLYGLILVALVAAVIIGGIRRIGTAASVIVPFMCVIYVIAAIAVILVNARQVPDAIGTILGSAFTLKAGMGGMIGTLIQGFKRSAFSNEAGTGSASIAHSAAATDEPIREGIVALLEPFIDTIVVCTMTGLVVVITGAYEEADIDGVEMTSHAFSTVMPWFTYVLTVAVVLFAFSTMISWSYYGERCATWLFGPIASLPYKLVFLVFVFLGCVFKLGNVLDFSDLMILGMSFPNIIGLYLLSGKVKSGLDKYWTRYQSGEFDAEAAELANRNKA
jgi:AGCS family alanine or glycine:cation symporter